MRTELTLVNLLLLAAIIVGCFLAISLFTVKKGNREANRVLGVLLILVCSLLGLTFYFNRIPVMDCPHLFSAATPIPLLFGPLLYLYIRTKVNGTLKFRNKDLVHFLPFAVLLITQTIFVILPFGSKITMGRILAGDSFDINNRMVMLNVFKIVFNLSYIWHSFSILEKSKNEKEFKGNQSTLQINWMKKLCGAIGLYWIVFTLVFIYQIIVNVNMLIVDNSLSLSLSVVVILIGFTVLQKPDLYVDEFFSPDKDKYRKSSLGQSQLAYISDTLTRAMSHENIYLDHELTLAKLADQTEISPHYISQTLSQHLELNFFDFVNEYRIDHAKQMLTNPENDHLTILAISEASGFNSKTSFNRAFKKFTGMTPSRFKKTSSSSASK